MEPLLFIHILAGAVALVAGLMAMVWPKGLSGHRYLGRLYFYSMLVIFLTALPLAWEDKNWFLLSISFFSFHMAFSGFRQAKTKGKTTRPTDRLIGIIMLGISMGMLVMGVSFGIQGNSGAATVIATFGLISSGQSLHDVRLAFGHLTQPRHWVRIHLSRMGGSYIAATTAFAVNVIHFWPPIVSWLLPTILGTLLLSTMGRSYRKNWKLD